jgi:anti-anti-sigma factor
MRMQIEKSSSGQLMELRLTGMLDNDSSMHLKNEIEMCTREGWHQIFLDMGGVTYMSSAGVSVLLIVKKQLAGLHGRFGVHNVLPQVEEVLRLMKLWELLRCDPDTVRTVTTTTTVQLSSAAQIASEAGYEFELYSLPAARPLKCQMIGHPLALISSAYRHSVIPKTRFGSNSVGLGLGALGDFADKRIGEFLAVAGGVALSPQRYGGLPDYSIVEGEFEPSVQIHYGMKLEGDWPFLIRFEPAETGSPMGLSALIRTSLKLTNCHTAGFLILADCAGLVGAQLRRLPPSDEVSEVDPFAVPGIRHWLSYSAEKIHRRNLVLIAGLATNDSVSEASPLRGFLRPMDSPNGLVGHFHAAVFPYRHMKKRTLQLESMISELFQSGSVHDVLHLLRDDRPITGLGESELLGGACWVAPLQDVTHAEGQE